MQNEPTEPIEPISLPRPETHSKGWGSELWIVNNEKYCGKILEFKEGGQFSFHYHMSKTETWYVLSGSFYLKIMDLEKGKAMEFSIGEGTTVHIPNGNPHQLYCLKAGKILEISTQHFESDSYRIAPGDSQK